MLFFLNLDGTVTRSDTDHVYQGQNKVANVELFTLISPAQAAIQVAFTLPNGLTTTYAPMSYVGAYSVDESNQKQVHRWKLAVPYNVTEVEGQVGVSFNVLLNDGTSGQTQETINQTTYTSSFLVEYSALPIPPTTATESELEQLLELLNLYYTQNASLAAKQPFVVGTVKTNTLDADQQASVAVEQSAVADGNGNYPTNFDFGIPQGTTFTPSVDDNGNISWSNDGGKANPVTKNIKGETGATGADGVTPNISVSATIDNNEGTPSVDVTKGGTDANPSFKLDFHNLKGATGATGADGNHITMAESSNHKFISLEVIEVGGTYRDINDWFFILGTYTGDDNKTYQQLAGCKVIEKGTTSSKARVMDILDLPLPKDGTDGKDGNATLLYDGALSASVTSIAKAQVTVPTGRSIQVDDIIISSLESTFGAMAQVTAIGDTTVNVDFIGTLQGGSGVSDYNELANKPIINQDLSADGFTPVANTYYRHTGTGGGTPAPVNPIEVGDTLTELYFDTTKTPDFSKFDWDNPTYSSGRFKGISFIDFTIGEITYDLLAIISSEDDFTTKGYSINLKQKSTTDLGNVLSTFYADYSELGFDPSRYGYEKWGWQAEKYLPESSASVDALNHQDIWGEYISKDGQWTSGGSAYETGAIYYYNGTEYKAITGETKTTDYNEIENIPVINQDLSAAGFTPTANTYYRHTGTTGTYTQGIIYLYDGTKYKALDGSSGVTDVQVAGTSVVADGVANIPISDKNIKGVVSDVVRRNSQFEFVTGTYSSGYLSPTNQSKGFALSKDGLNSEFAIYPDTTWGNIIYSSYQSKPLHLYVSATDSIDADHIGFYRTELRRYSTRNNFDSIELPTISGTMMVAPTTWSSGTSGSLTLTEGGTYQFYAGSATKTNYTLLYVVLGTESVAYAGKNVQLETDTNNVVHVYDTSGAEPTEVTIELKYRRIGI